MITKADIDLMHEWHDEIYVNRERPVSAIYTSEEYDDITGAPIGRGEVVREVSAVVTELSGASIEMAGGIVYDNVDIKFDIDLAYIADIADELVRIEHDEKEYKVIAFPRKGIGRRNRVEYLGRSIS